MPISRNTRWARATTRTKSRSSRVRRRWSRRGQGPRGIGYSGIGYRTSEVRALPLAKKAGEALVEPTFDNALNGKYPLGRALYIYVDKKPNEPLPPLVKEFLKFVLSKEGQEVVDQGWLRPVAEVGDREAAEAD